MDVQKIDSAARVAPFMQAANDGTNTVAAVQSALEAAKFGMRGVFEAAFVALIGADLELTSKEASKEFSRMVPASKSGTGATYRSNIVKALGDSALFASLRSPFTTQFLAMATAEDFGAMVAEQTAVLHAAVQAIVDAGRAPKEGKAKEETAQGAIGASIPAPAPAAETVQDVLARIMADLDTLAAEAAIGNVEAHAAFNAVFGRFTALQDGSAERELLAA